MQRRERRRRQARIVQLCRPPGEVRWCNQEQAAKRHSRHRHSYRSMIPSVRRTRRAASCYRSSENASAPMARDSWAVSRRRPGWCELRSGSRCSSIIIIIISIIIDQQSAINDRRLIDGWMDGARKYEAHLRTGRSRRLASMFVQQAYEAASW